MIQLQEKRNAIRHICDGQVTLHHTQRQARRIEARLINFSEHGLSFFSQHPLTPGTTIIVRVSGESYQNLSADTACQLRTMGFATIKWCQENRRQGRPIHEMGAVYLVPY